MYDAYALYINTRIHLEQKPEFYLSEDKYILGF